MTPDTSCCSKILAINTHSLRPYTHVQWTFYNNTHTMYTYIINACAVPGVAMATPKWFQVRRPCPAARPAVANTPVRCSSLPPPEPIRRSANYQPNSWSYASMESLLEAANKCDRNQVSFNYVKLISLLISGLISNIFARKLKKTLAYCSIGCPVTPAVRARGSFFFLCRLFFFNRV